MKTFENINKTLTNATSTVTKIGEARQSNVKDAINAVVAFGTKAENKLKFNGKKNAKAEYIKQVLGDATADNYFKRAIGVAHSIEVEGYRVKVELLTLAQMEQLTAFNKNLVNGLMKHEGDIYVDAVKALIKTAKVTKSTKVFSKATAKAVKAKK